MRWLSIVLMIGVFVRHDTSYLASNLTPLTPGAWFTVMGGLWEIVLCAALLMFVNAPLGMAALLIGILEGAQISVCRAMIADISAVPPKTNLCDFITGWPIGFLMTFAELGMVCWVIGRSWRSASRS